VFTTVPVDPKGPSFLPRTPAHTAADLVGGFVKAAAPLTFTR
jgi:hypothetical protein